MAMARYGVSNAGSWSGMGEARGVRRDRGVLLFFLFWRWGEVINSWTSPRSTASSLLSWLVQKTQVVLSSATDIISLFALFNRSSTFTQTSFELLSHHLLSTTNYFKSYLCHVTPFPAQIPTYLVFSPSTITAHKMPSQTPTPIALPIPRRRSPLLNNATFGQDISLSLSNTLNLKAKSPYTFITRDIENDYSPPAPPPPSPVNFSGESWNTACSIKR